MLAFALWGVPAWPCAGLVHEEGLSAESDAAEVLLEPGAGSVTASYAMAFRGDAPDLGWVIPVPGEVAAVEDGDAARFDSLRELSLPRVEVLDAAAGGGCSACAASKGGLEGGTRGGANDVTVTASGFTGTYDYLVVSASDGGALQQWFADNGWEGLAAEDLDHYVSDGWSFVALRVEPASVEEALGDRPLPPVSITYGGDRIAFPAVMARHATVETQRTTIYVVGDTRAALQGAWTAQDTGTLYGGLGADPERLWEEHLAVVGRDRGYARTFAGDTGDGFLTRFDTLAPRDVHDADVSLVLEDSVEPLSTTVVLGDEVPPGAALLLPLAGIGVLRRRRAAG